MHIRRAAESGISWRPKVFKLEELNRDAVYTLRGPRQVGRTTYLKMLIKELLERNVEGVRILYLSCDPIESVGELEATLLSYLKWEVKKSFKERVFIFLDEVTRIMDWQLAVKDSFDHGLLENVCIIACGSLVCQKSITP